MRSWTPAKGSLWEEKSSSDCLFAASLAQQPARALNVPNVYQDMAEEHGKLSLPVAVVKTLPLLHEALVVQFL